MIRIENLTKNYGATMALDNLNLTINDGEIFGLIGHNGAGKSTTIKSLVSILEPTSGQIYFDDLDLKSNRDMIDKDLREERIKSLCQIFSLEVKATTRIEECSHGMRQKVFLIGALISDPKIWILDEPMTGLDPQSAYNLKELMKDHASQGNTVLFSTHVLEVAEQLCDRIGILSKGRILFLGTMDELKDRHPGQSLEDIYLAMVNHKPQDTAGRDEASIYNNVIADKVSQGPEAEEK